jgi:hypothetical protein
MPRAKTPKNAPNKSDFIRSQPATLSAAEVVAKAKTEGVTILPGLVYEVRRKAKARAKGKKRATAKSSAVSTVASTVGWSVANHAETLLRAVGAEIGLGRAIELLHDERARVHSIVRE